MVSMLFVAAIVLGSPSAAAPFMPRNAPVLTEGLAASDIKAEVTMRRTEAEALVLNRPDTVLHDAATDVRLGDRVLEMADLGPRLEGGTLTPRLRLAGGDTAPRLELLGETPSTWRPDQPITYVTILEASRRAGLTGEVAAEAARAASAPVLVVLGGSRLFVAQSALVVDDSSRERQATTEFVTLTAEVDLSVLTGEAPARFRVVLGMPHSGQGPAVVHLLPWSGDTLDALRPGYRLVFQFRETMFGDRPEPWAQVARVRFTD